MNTNIKRTNGAKPFQTNVSNINLKRNIRKFLNSKIAGGGLYGLTISDSSFVDELVEVVNLSLKRKKWEKPFEEEELNPF